MARTRVANNKRLAKLEALIHVLKEKYGPTFTIDMSNKEKKELVRLRKEIDFAQVACDGKTHD